MNDYKDHLTPDQLNNFRNNVAHEKMLLIDSVEKIIRDCSMMYNRPLTKEACKLMATKLIESGYKFKSIKDGINRIIETSGNFPSYSELVSSVRLFMPQDHFESKSDLEFQKEELELERLKSEFERVIGQDALEKFLKWHLKNVFEIQYVPNIHGKFIKCALFDWRDSNFSNDFNKIKSIGISKLRKKI
jgi:Arc/MetJ-type ribon-helix-helix transcriptional regulator